MAKQAKNLALGDSVALESDVAGKLDQGSAAPVFDDTVAYVSGYHVTYGGKLYRFTADHAAGAWTGNDVVLENMTTPDAMLDITSANKLRVVAADGTILWTEQDALGYTPEDSANKVTSVTAQSTDAQYPSAKCVYELFDDVEPLLFAQFYPDGSVKSTTEFTQGIKYNAPDTVNRTITVKPFCNTGTAENDNSNLEGRVVIPPFVDASGNGYISDDGTRYKVVGVSDGSLAYDNTNLTAIVAPNTVTTIGGIAFADCTSLTSISLPSAQTIGESAFSYCTLLDSADFGATPRSSVPTLNLDAFNGVPTTCKIIVPDAQYDAWTAATNWSTLYANGYKFLKYSEWEYARRYEVQKVKDAIGIPEFESTATYAVGKLVMYSNAIWKCKTAIATAGAWDASKWDRILEFGTNVTIPGSLTVGIRNGTAGTHSVAEGYNVTAGGECSHAEGQNNTASQYCTHAEGYGNTASGYVSHAEGQSSTASGYTSHAEGYCNTASGICAHAEGAGTYAVGTDSHAEGSGGNDPAYGAKGYASHVEGHCTVAENQYEHAQGYYNASHKANGTWGDPGNTLSSIGFAGPSSNWNPRNAVETMQDGKTFVYGLGNYNGTNPTGSGVLDLASAVNAKAEAADLRYAITTKTPTVSSGTAAISLDDRTCNVSETTASVVELTFPVATSGHARDFLLLLDTTGSSSAPTLAYASYMTIVADEDADLTPIVGQNLYTFTEIARNTFVATRTTLTTIATQVPQDAQGVVSAASQAGYDMTNVNTPGQLATALGLTNSADFEDCANKVMFG